MIGDQSYPELEIDRSHRRRLAVAAFRQSAAACQNEVDQFHKACVDFLRLLIRAPHEVVVAYSSTSDELREARWRLEDYRDGLAAGKGRLKINFKYLKPRDAAQRVIVRYDPGFLKTYPNCGRQAVIRHAVTILESKIKTVDEKSRFLEQSRAAIVDAARNVTERMHGAAPLGLIERITPAWIHWETLVDYCFCGSIAMTPVSKATRQAALAFVRDEVLKRPLVNLFERFALQVEQCMKATLPAVVERKKQEFFNAEAAGLAADLDDWCDRHSSCAGNPLATAIMGLRFSFVSARQGIGGLSASLQAKYEKELATAVPSEMDLALEALLRTGLLTSEDCELFRYTPSVGRPFRELASVHT